MVGEKLLIYRAGKLAKQKTGRKCSISYEEAKSIGVIFTVDDLNKHNTVKEFIKKLKNDSKQVEVICFLPKGKENHEFLYSFFTEKDISFLGKFNNIDVIKFAARQFDFLFCLDFDPHPLVESIFGITKSSCRVGCYKAEKDHFYELMIQPKKQTTENLADELFRYIKILR